MFSMLKVNTQMHTLSEHFVFPCTPKRTPNCTPNPEKRPFSPI